MPVLPGITDRPDALAALVRAVAEGGASHINACALRLRVTSRRRYLPWLEQEFPELTARYQRAYGRDHQITDRYREGLRQFLKRACRKAGIRYGSSYDTPADGGTYPVRANAPRPPTNARTLPVVQEEAHDEDGGTGNDDSAPITDPQFALGL